MLKETQNGDNKGRWYWSCPNESAKARCKFFEWATDEEVAEAQAARPRYRTYENRSDSRNSNSNYGGGGGASGPGACFKASMQVHVYVCFYLPGVCLQCGQDGHWANGVCPSKKLYY